MEHDALLCLLLQLVLVNFMVSLEAKQGLSLQSSISCRWCHSPGESFHLEFQAAIGQALMVSA